MNRRPWVCWIGFCIVLAGCGGGNGLTTAPVKGKVLVNGQPLSHGTISFRPEAGSPATGEIRPDGTFTLTTFKPGDGAIVGTHEVLVVATERDAGTIPPPQPGEEVVMGKSIIPQKYTSFSTSGLTADVVAGEDNSFTFELRN